MRGPERTTPPAVPAVAALRAAAPPARRAVALAVGLSVAATALTAVPASAATPRAEPGLPSGRLASSAIVVARDGSRQLLVQQVRRTSGGVPTSSQLWSLRQRGDQRRWTDAVRVGGPVAGDTTDLHLATPRRGVAVATWTVGTDTSKRLVASARRPATADWQTPKVLSGGTHALEGAEEVSLSTTRSGDAVVGWADATTEGDAVVRSRTYRASGSWSAATTAGQLDDAALAATPSGEQVAVGVQDGGDYVSAARPASGTWGAVAPYWSPAGAFSDAGATPLVLEGPPDIAAAADGTIASSWTFASGAPTGSAVTGTNRLLVGVRSAAGAWAAPVVLETTSDLAFKCRHQLLVDARGRYTVVAVLPTTPGKADVVASTSGPGGAGPWKRSDVLRGIDRSDAFVSSIDAATGRTVVLVQGAGRTREVASLSAVSRSGADGAWGRPTLITRSALRDPAGTTFSGGAFLESYGFLAAVGPRGVSIAARTVDGGLLTTRLP